MIFNLLKPYKWWIPILMMLGIAPFTPKLDLFISGFFYQLNENGLGQFRSNFWLDLVFNYGIIPAQLVALLALFFLPMSFFLSGLKKWQHFLLTLVITLVLGSGLIINLGLKDHWGRPRPKQVTDFGGTKPFRAFYQANFLDNSKENYKSFPCGHCSMGFYFFTFTVLGIRLKKKWLIYLGLVLGGGLGGILSLTRIMQGGHFFSDVLMSALIMWLTALVVDYCLNRKLSQKNRGLFNARIN